MHSGVEIHQQQILTNESEPEAVIEVIEIQPMARYVCAGTECISVKGIITSNVRVSVHRQQLGRLNKSQCAQPARFKTEKVSRVRQLEGSGWYFFAITVFKGWIIHT